MYQEINPFKRNWVKLSEVIHIKVVICTPIVQVDQMRLKSPCTTNLTIIGFGGKWRIQRRPWLKREQRLIL